MLVSMHLSGIRGASTGLPTHEVSVPGAPPRRELPARQLWQRKQTVDAHEVEIGYELAPVYWSNGYTADVARTIVRFGFAKLHLHRVSA